jgi:hypothetical protein
MEARTITVYSTKTNVKTTIMSTAETLGELKTELRANGVDFADMTFFEGVSRTELVDDNSALPKDIMYKGTRTNNLAFMLTNSNKKIKSGALEDTSRANVYTYIKEYGLQEMVKEVLGKNYTQCKTEDLVNIVNSVLDAEEYTCSECGNTNCITEELSELENFIIKSITLVVDITNDLANKGLINFNKIERFVNKNTQTCEDNKKEELKSPYSDKELSEMFDFIG